ncbi:MAG: hypothetical protein J6Q79_05930 [Clostridia bacterium]|nr:hypothetical protein [Clostridia bacterium]
MTNYPFKYIPLDNAGKIFPGQISERWAYVYRMTIELKEEIDPEILKAALAATLDRLPTFKVRMKNGIFENLLEANDKVCPVNPDIKNFCYRINYQENNGYLMRVYYHKNYISVECFHALCDAYGATVFISTLAGQYLNLKGHSISYNQFVLNVNESPKAEEMEDAYERYATSKKTAKLLESPAYHKKGEKMPLHMCNYTALTMSFKELHAISKSYGVTVTELLAAILLDIHYKKQLSEGNSKKDVSVQIPVNLRKAFPSKSVRNFVICLTVKMPYRKKGFTFDEIVRSVSQQLRKANNYDFLHAYISQTVKMQTKLLKYVPLIVKNTAVKVSFHFGAEFSTTTLLSNLGPVVLPDDMKEHVERYFFYNSPGLVNGARCSIVSFDDKLTLTFSNVYKEDDIERAFLSKIASLGISVVAETNRDEDFGDLDGVTVGDRQAYADTVHIPTDADISGVVTDNSI